MHLRFYEEPLDNGGILTCGQNSSISPILIVIHGGKASGQAAVEYCKSFYEKLADLGFPAFSIDYPENMTLIEEINYIIEAIKYNQDGKIIDHGKICIVGTSGGGYLTLMTDIESSHIFMLIFSVTARISILLKAVIYSLTAISGRSWMMLD